MDAKENSRKSFDLQAATYDIDRNGSHARTVYEPVMDRLKKLRCKNILDVGCGTGEMLKRIIGQIPSVRCTGMDISEKMIDAAKAKLGDSASLLTGDAESLPFEDSSFDLLICNDSFHHYPAPEKALAEFRRVLIPDGTLLISDYCAPFPLRQLMNLFISRSRDGDVHIYSHREITSLILNAGFINPLYKRVSSTAYIITARNRQAAQKWI